MLVLEESFIHINLEAESSNEVIEVLSDSLYAAGMVGSKYAEDTIAREMEHPTGLPTKPFSIAFPHADAQGVSQSALAVALLKEPVTFRNMGDPEEDLLVEIVIMLANKEPEEQIETLRSLATLFGQPEKLSELRALTEPGKVVTWLKQELQLS